MASSSSSWKKQSRKRLKADANKVGMRALKGRNVKDDICVILGRPTLWLILTYEGSAGTIWPGFSTVQEESGGSFKFQRIYGRAAKEEPKCDMQEAVAYGWRECILPWICQESLEEDVLCVLLEEDWRPWRTEENDEDDARNCDANLCLAVIRSMVSLFNAAAHHDSNCGLIWYSWEGEKKGKRLPRHGLMAIGLTVGKARQMKVEVDRDKGDLGHFDVWMLNWINRTEPVTSVFVRPPFGGYYSHQSGCDASFKDGEERVCDWKKCFQMEDHTKVDLVNFKDTYKQLPWLPFSPVHYISRVAREEAQLDEGTRPASKRQKRQLRRVRQLQERRVGGDAARETRPGQMRISQAERGELKDVMAKGLVWKKQKTGDGS